MPAAAFLLLLLPHPLSLLHSQAELESESESKSKLLASRLVTMHVEDPVFQVRHTFPKQKQGSLYAENLGNFIKETSSIPYAFW